MEKILEIINRGEPSELRALFEFEESTPSVEVILKFNLWVRNTFPLQFKHKDALFHKIIDENNLKIYRGEKTSFVDIVFRGGAKTTRTKLFLAFCIAFDRDHKRRFIKVLTKDISNAKQIVTDIYNMLINEKVERLIPLFVKTKKKREETMGSFTTSQGVKLKADSVGVDQRGQVQGDEESARPDLIIFDDFETRKTLRSAVETKMIWDNMEEARTGLSKDGGCIYLCNYISERGNVHKLVTKERAKPNNCLLIQPIIRNGEPVWDLYSKEDIEKMKVDDDDFEGERLCQPSAGADVVFHREQLENMEKKAPIETSIGFKMFYKFDPSHRYGAGADIGGGLGLDHTTSVFIDFSTIPAKVVGTFASNTIKPDVFGDELKRQADFFGTPIIAPENNKFDMCIGRLKQIYKNIYRTQKKDSSIHGGAVTYGWNTNKLTKPKMIFDLKKAIDDGLLELSDENLIYEVMSYSRDDLMDRDVDVRLTTRHHDLLISCAIAWQMKDFVSIAKTSKEVQYIREKRKQLPSFGVRR